MRAAVADWSATNVAALTEADQESVKEIFEARVKEGGKVPPAKKKEAAYEMFAYEMFSPDYSDSDDDGEKETQAPPAKKKQKKASEKPQKKSAADVARQMVDAHTTMLSQGVSEATMKQFYDMQATVMATLKEE
jgi:hypothetical protein